jgi:lysophospholipase L1-like esterase
MITDLDTLLDKLVAGAPDALIVLAQIIPLGYGDNQKIKDYNAEIPKIVQARANAGEHITMVDMFSGFATNTMLDNDSIHPNTAGYKFMADKWYSVIDSELD